MSAGHERELLPIAGPREARRVIAALAAEHRGLCALAALTVIAGAAAGLLVPPLLGRLVDVALDDGAEVEIAHTALLIAAAVLVQGVLAGIGAQLTARLGETVLAALREHVVSRALAIPLARLERAGAGDLLSRVSGDVAVVSQAISFVVPEFARAAVVAVLTIGGLTAIDPRLALAALIAVPIQLGGLRWYLRHVVPVYRRQRIAEGERTQQLVAAIGGAATARALGLGAQRRARVRESSQHAVSVALHGVRLQSTRFWPAINGAELAGLSAVLVTGFLLVRADAISVGAATAGALYFHRAFDPVATLLALVDDIQDATSALARLAGVAAVEPPAEPASPATPADGSVALRGVDHAYVEGHPVLTGIDLTIAHGERVAVIGATGAGKTTLARLVAGIHHPTAGEVALGGAPLAALGPAGARRTVALVTQEVHVFAGTLAADLRLARADATDGELRAALGRVGALPWVDALPDGLETVVGDGGRRLSATQAQQLALARVLLRDPPVVILDEATAEAGSAGAHALEQAAEAALQGRTALVVAHRLTQAASADRIVVLEGGRIAEQGRHEDLIASGGHYATLWRAWSAARAA